MTKKKGLSDYSDDDLVHDLAYRLAKKHFRRGMTMSEMELCIDDAFRGENALAALRLFLSRMPIEAPTGKLCPKCGMRTAVKAKDRERTLRTLVGTVTLKRNYHYCDGCQLGWYPLDRTLALPEEGELTAEMEKRALDFAINDVYGDCADRWRLHYRAPLSETLFRNVVSRVGLQCEQADQQRLQFELKAPPEKLPEVLVAEVDGSYLAIRDLELERWKEAKVGVIYRHDPLTKKPIAGSARYVAVVNGFGEFGPAFEDALRVEKADEVYTVLWLGDGAVCNWRLAEQLLPNAIQILDWYHAVKHAMDCGKVLLGEESPLLPLWQERAEALLAAGEPDALIAELMSCIAALPSRGRAEALTALDDLIRYYRTNAHRMRYAAFREAGWPIGSGAAESAHRHVLQVRMKRAGQRWAMRNARKMAGLRAAYRTAGPLDFHAAIQRARTRDRTDRSYWRRGHFRYAREGTRERQRCFEASSN
jgi:hypothetical protein